MTRILSLAAAIQAIASMSLVRNGPAPIRVADQVLGTARGSHSDQPGAYSPSGHRSQKKLRLLARRRGRF